MNILNDHKIVFDGIFGSTLYGTNTPESDTDYKAIFLPKPKDIILGIGSNHFNQNTSNDKTKNTSNDVDREFYSLKYFIDLAIKGETVALDMIHTPIDMNLASKNKVWEFIQQNRHRFYTTDMKAYLGYVRKQAAKYGIKGSRLAALREVLNVVDKIPNSSKMNHVTLLGKIPVISSHLPNFETRIENFKNKLPTNEFVFFEKDSLGNEYYNVLGRKCQTTIKISELKERLSKIWTEYGERAKQAESNQGIDWKALSHAYRGGVQLLEIYKTGDLEYPLKDADFIKQIKAGKIEFKQFQPLLENLVSEVDHECQLAKLNGMPDKVDKNFWYDFVANVYFDEIKGFKR